MLRRFIKYAVFIIAIMTIVGTSKADHRFYVWTYQYQTMERGKSEFEYYTTFSSPSLKNSAGATTAQHKLELEIGMTDRFDFSIYQKFSQKPGKSFNYDGYEFRARYRFFEKGKYFIDPLIYLEYKGVPDFSSHVLEGKIILAKDIGKLNIAVNPIFEFEPEHGEIEFIPGYAAGISYEFGKTTRIGLEVKGDKDGHYAGPVISHGTQHLWAAISPIFKVSEIEAGKPEFYLRMIVGVGL